MEIAYVYDAFGNEERSGSPSFLNEVMMTKSVKDKSTKKVVNDADGTTYDTLLNKPLSYYAYLGEERRKKKLKKPTTPTHTCKTPNCGRCATEQDVARNLADTKEAKENEAKRAEEERILKQRMAEEAKYKEMGGRSGSGSVGHKVGCTCHNCKYSSMPAVEKFSFDPTTGDTLYMAGGQWRPLGYKNYYYRIDPETTGVKDLPDIHIKRGINGNKNEFETLYTNGDSRHKGKSWPKGVRERLVEMEILQDVEIKYYTIESTKTAWGYVFNGLLLLGSSILIGYLILNDLTIVGAIDDVLIPGAAAVFSESAAYVFG